MHGSSHHSCDDDDDEGGADGVGGGVDDHQPTIMAVERPVVSMSACRVERAGMVQTCQILDLVVVVDGSDRFGVELVVVSGVVVVLC